MNNTSTQLFNKICY